MNENTKTDDSDGFLRMSQKIQKTKILPLRWIGNLCGEISATSLVKALDLQEDDYLGYRFTFHCKVWHYLNKPYEKWGTYYMVDLDYLKNDPVLEKLGSDYDEDGVPYWENEGGPVDKTEERLRYMEENGI
jgi:hypothetical protein